MINYSASIVYIQFIGTYSEYDKINAVTIPTMDEFSVFCSADVATRIREFSTYQDFADMRSDIRATFYQKNDSQLV